MKRLDGRFRRWIQKLREEPEKQGRLERAIVRAVDLGLHGGSELRRIRAPQMAAALTFHTLFSLIPTIALVLVMLQVFVGPTQREEFKDGVIEWVLSPLRAGDPASENPPEEIVSTNGRQDFERAQRALDVRFEEAIRALEKIDFRSVGLVGLLMFLLAATALLQTVERSFNSIYQARRTRSLRVRLPLYYSVVTVGPLVLMAGLFIRGRFLAVVESGSWTSWLAGPLVFLSPLFTVWLVLLAIYLWIPNTRVGIRAAAIGAVVAAGLCYLGMELLGLYIQHAAGATLLGALALVPLFLFWLYLLWLFVLFGLQVSYIIQTFKMANLGQEIEKKGEDWFLDADWVVPVAEQVAVAFRRGELATSEQLEVALGLPLPGLNRLLTALEQRKILLVVEKDEQVGYSLARPADTIQLTELLDVARELAPKAVGSSQQKPVWKILDEVQQAGKRVVGERTLADLFDNGNS